MFRLKGVRQDFHSDQLESWKLHLTTFKKNSSESNIMKVEAVDLVISKMKKAFFQIQQHDDISIEAWDAKL